MSWNEAEFNFLSREKTFPTRLLGLLENRVKSGDMAVLEITFRNVSLGKWSKNWSCYWRKRIKLSAIQKSLITYRLVDLIPGWRSVAKFVTMPSATNPYHSYYSYFSIPPIFRFTLNLIHGVSRTPRTQIAPDPQEPTPLYSWKDMILIVFLSEIQIRSDEIQTSGAKIPIFDTKFT